MQFSRAVDYAIHALLSLARSADGMLLVTEIARTARVPQEYLRKVLRELARAGVVVARRGVAGGYRLARRPTQITLRDVVDAVEGGVPGYACVAHVRGCGLHSECPVHRAFLKAAEGMSQILSRVTLESVRSDTPVALPRDGRRR